MIVRLLLKYWRNILDALLVVVLIVGIFLINPFGIFGDGLRLRHTANLVSNVRSIGQLVTAEYYGEVIASLDESQVNFIEEDNLSSTAEELYIWLKRRSFDVYKEKILTEYDESEIQKNKKAVKKSMDEVVSAVTNIYKNNTRTQINILDRYYLQATSTKDDSRINTFRKDTADIMLLYLGQEIFKDKIKTKKYTNGQNRSKLQEEQLGNLVLHVKKMYHQLSEEDFAQFLGQGFESTRQFSEYYFEYKHDEIVDQKGKKESKKKLAMIGRGSVKAGFDFSKLDEKKFKYDQEKATIHLFGVQAKILNSDINPWFIPERQVPGFDILTYSGDVTFEDAQTVKEYCKRKLEMYAKEADILNQANQFGKDGLITFFSLLTGEKIKSIQFHADELGYAMDDISSDNKVTRDELVLIDSLLINYQKIETNDEAIIEQRTILLDSFMKQLMNLSLQINDSAVAPMNFYTRQLPAILTDGVIDTKEFEVLKSIRPDIVDTNAKFNPKVPSEDQIWFKDSLAVMDDYNAMLEFLQGIKKTKYYELEEERMVIPKDKGQYHTLITDLNSKDARYLSYSVSSDSLKKVRIKGAFMPGFDSLLFNINTDRELLIKIERGNVWPSDIMYGLKNELGIKAKYDTAVSVYKYPKSTLTAAQQNESEAYQKWLQTVIRSNYEEQGAIVHASDWVKANMFNKDNFTNIQEALSFWRK